MAKRMKEKAARRAENKDKRPSATAKYIRISPFKVRIVLNLIRGKKVSEALAILETTPRAASPIIKKVLLSACANAEHNLNLNVDDLYVQEALANMGPVLKRVQPMAHGRAFRILKRTSHITVVLGPKKEVA